MQEAVTEDRTRKVRWSGFKPLAIFEVCISAVLAVGVVPARAQSGGTEDAFTVKVVDVSKDSRSLSIPLHRSVIIETSIEISRTSVVNSQIADVQPVSPTQLLITGKTYGQTNVVLWGGKDKQYVLDVLVDLDVEALNATLQSIDPQSTIKAAPVLGNILLSGTVSSALRASRMEEVANLFLSAGQGTGGKGTVQNHLEVAGEQQVLLRCIVAEVNRSATRKLGINGFLAGDDFGHGFVVNQVGSINPIDISAVAGSSATETIPFALGGSPLSPSVPLSLGFPRVQMQVFINALADNSLLRVLAEPNLVAISGETASFLAGGEFPVPVPQGFDKVTIEFREFGVRLNFTPIVRGHQLIRLRVAPEVSELDFSNAVVVGGLAVPGLKTRSAETTIEVGNGQTIAIAGLLNEEVRAIVSRVPGIGDVPVLGALFRSVNFQRSLTELVILVTPEIIAPMDRIQVPPLPGESITDPSDFDLYALGLIEGRPGDGARTRSATTDSDGSPAMSQPDRLSIHGPWGQERELENR